MLVFLALNGIEIDYLQSELADVILELASGKKGYEDLLSWVLDHLA